MNISNLIEMSSLINSGSLVKWEFMSGGVMKIIPLYKEGYLDSIKDKDQEILSRARKFLDSALEGMNLKDKNNGALPEDHLTSSRTFEISLKVLLSLPHIFDLKEWNSIADKLKYYKYLVNKIIEKEQMNPKEITALEEVRTFFKALADISRNKRVASVFSHES